MQSGAVGGCPRAAAGRHRVGGVDGRHRRGAPGEDKNPAAAPARALSQSFREVVKEVQPSVVLIKSEAAMPVKLEGRNPGDEEGGFEQWFGDKQFGAPFRGMPDLRKFFQQMPRMPEHGQSGMGSGLIIDKAGLILTNRHVIDGGKEITVRLHDGREYKATKVAADPKTDLAVSADRGRRQPHARQARRQQTASRWATGCWPWAARSAWKARLPPGIISAKGRGLGIAEREDFIQTDASINPGNSGGPLVNLDGEVIGINTAISSNSGGNEGVGFAIPINLAKWVAQQLSNGGTVHRARLGVMIQPLTDELAHQFGLKAREGVVVADVTPDSPAAKAGLKSGDVIVEFAGKAIATPQELQTLVERSAAGKEQPLYVLRDGKRTELSVSPTEMPGDGKTAEGSPAETSRMGKLGMEFQNLTPELAKQLEIKADHGVVVTDVQPGSPAERAGVSAGMVIAEVNRKPVKTVEDLTKALDEKSLERGVMLLVRARARESLCRDSRLNHHASYQEDERARVGAAVYCRPNTA